MEQLIWEYVLKAQRHEFQWLLCIITMHARLLLAMKEIAWPKLHEFPSCVVISFGSGSFILQIHKTGFRHCYLSQMTLLPNARPLFVPNILLIQMKILISKKKYYCLFKVPPVCLALPLLRSLASHGTISFMFATWIQHQLVIRLVSYNN